MGGVSQRQGNVGEVEGPPGPRTRVRDHIRRAWAMSASACRLGAARARARVRRPRRRTGRSVSGMAATEQRYCAPAPAAVTLAARSAAPVVRVALTRVLSCGVGARHWGRRTSNGSTGRRGPSLLTTAGALTPLAPLAVAATLPDLPLSAGAISEECVGRKVFCGGGLRGQER